ncbi:MAG: hypothetical protein RR272_00910 [Synergistaceae bacterium]
MSIEKLLEKLDEAQTPEEIFEIGQEILAIDPASPYGKLAVWEGMPSDESAENLDMLTEALDKIRAIVEAKENPPVIENDRDAQVYCTIMMNLGYSLLVAEKHDDALAIAREFANFDDEGFFPSRTLLYRCMLDMGMYNDILLTLESDPCESVVGEHARVLALIETDANDGEIRDALNYAISLAPDVPFFILNIWDFPDDDEDVDEDYEDILTYATYLADPWTADDKRIGILSVPTFLFGYLTGRLEDEKEITLLKEGYESAGLLEEVEEAQKRIEEMNSEGKDVDETDAFALGYTAEIAEKLLTQE